MQQQHSQAEPHEKPQKRKRQDKTQEKLEAKQENTLLRHKLLVRPKIKSSVMFPVM